MVVSAEKIREFYTEFLRGGAKNKVVHYEDDCKVSVYKVQKIIRIDIKPMGEKNG